MNSAQEWRILLHALRDLRAAASADAALVTLVRTHGSTFRRAGTRMLVHADSRVVCELSGGCPQRDIVLRSQESIADGTPQTVAYNAESGMDVLLEMGCGGELEVLIEPLLDPASTAFAEPLLACIENRRHVWLATWFGRDGRPAPTRHLIWNADGVVHDEFDDAVLARAVAAVVERDGLRHALTLRLPALGCEAEVLVEPVSPPHALAIIGTNAAAKAFVPVIDLLGWQLTLVDSDPRRLAAEQLAPGVRAICAGPARVRELLPLDADSSVLVMTHNVEQDIAYLAALRDSSAVYIGALGSRERAERMRDDGGYSSARRLHAPAGLDVGSETPTEIAMSVVAEILMALNRRGGGPLYSLGGTIHG